MAKTLLIIGAGIEQIPAYIAAKKRGIFVVGSDKNNEAPAFAYADAKIIASTRDAIATELAAFSFHQEHPIDGVMTIANDVPYTVARVAHRLGLPAISLSAAHAASNKLVMKECFKSHGVACPWFTPIRSQSELKELIERGRHGDRFVLKPVDGRGARGVLLVDSQSDLDWAYSESLRWSDSAELILERYIPGLQISTESFILDGKIYTPAIAERNYSRLEQFLPYMIEDGGTIPAFVDEKTRTAIDDLVLRGAMALGVESGIIKGDIVIDSAGQPMIIELAARLSGGWLASHMIPEATGVSLIDAVISFSLREPITPESLTPTRNRSTAIRYWFPPPGLIHNIEGEEHLKTFPGIVSYGLFRAVGEVQPEVQMHSQRFGYVIVSGDNREQAHCRVREALDSVHIEVRS